MPALFGRWLTNVQPYNYQRLSHFVEGNSSESYCGLIGLYGLGDDIVADRACFKCLMYLYRDGYLHFREKVPNARRPVLSTVYGA